MHKNYLWQGFLLVVLAATLWYTIVAIYRYNSYTRLTAQTVAESMNWEILKQDSEHYRLFVTYIINVNGKSFEGSTEFIHDPYRNEWGANQGLKEASSKSWLAWYNPKNPHHSSLQKYFPLKECISAGILWILFLYFVWLGYYVANKKSQY